MEAAPVTAPPAIAQQTERTFQAAVIDYAVRRGWRIFHHRDSRRQVRPGVHVGDTLAAGYPDLTLCRDRVVWAELKRQGGRASAAQLDWLDALHLAGHEAYLWDPRDWDEIERVLQ